MRTLMIGGLILALVGCAQIYPSPEEERAQKAQALRAWYRGPMMDSCTALPGPESRHGCVLVIKRILAQLRGDSVTRADHYEVELAKAKGSDEVRGLLTGTERAAWLRGPRTRACRQAPSPADVRSCLAAVEDDMDKITDTDESPGTAPEVRAERAVARIEARERERTIDQERERDRQASRDAAAMQALGLGLLGGGPIRSHQYQPPFPQQPLTAPAAPLYQAPVSRPPVNCTSNTVGQYTYTNCN